MIQHTLEVTYSHRMTSLIDWKTSRCRDTVVVNNWKMFFSFNNNTWPEWIFVCTVEVFKY